jgi:hypothetical protein
MFIYVIVCSETLKIYIGQHKKESLTRYLQQKWWQAHHHLVARSHLYTAMRKYPRESWSIHPLVSDVQTREELDVLEQHYIRVLNSQHPDVGYNICRGGEGFTGPHTEEWRRETLKRIKDYWANPENRNLRSQETKARWQRPELRQATEQWRAENPEKLAYWTGKTQSKESNRKRSASLLGHKNTLGRVQSPEEKAQRSVSMLLYHASKHQEKQDFLIHK